MYWMKVKIKNGDILGFMRLSVIDGDKKIDEDGLSLLSNAVRYHTKRFDERGCSISLSDDWFRKVDGVSAIDWLMENKESKIWKVLFEIIGGYDNKAEARNSELLEERSVFLKLLTPDQKAEIWSRVLKESGFEHNMRVEYKQNLFEEFLNDMSTPWLGDKDTLMESAKKLMKMGKGISNERMDKIEQSLLVRGLGLGEDKSLMKKSI